MSNMTDKKPDKDNQIIVLDPRQELPNISRTITGSRLITIMQTAENGDTRELFALYRDMLADNQIQTDFTKRKAAVLGDTINIQPADKNNPADIAAVDLCDDLADSGAFIDAMSWCLNATLWPVAVAEKTYAWNGSKFTLSKITPVHYQLLDYSDGHLRIFDLDPTGKPLNTSHLPDPSRYIIHRGHTLPMRDQDGGPMRALLFWWLLRTQSRQWWADLLERYGIPFLKGKYSDPEGKAVLQNAFKLAVRLGAIVTSKSTEVEVVQAATGDSANSHEKFVELCNREISKLIVGQSLSTNAQPTGLGEGASGLQGEVRDDLRKMDAALLARTLRDQLLAQYCTINNAQGQPPNLIFGSDSSSELAALMGLLKTLKESGLEPDDDGLSTLSERIGFTVRRSSTPSFSPTGFNVEPLSAKLAKGTTDLIAPSESSTLAEAFTGQLAPLRKIIEASSTPEECISKARAWALSASVNLSADLLESALTAYTANGIKSTIKTA